MSWKVVPVAAALALQLAVAPAADLKVGFTADAVTPDPGNYRARDTETLLRLMYDGLTTHDRQMKVVPDQRISGFVEFDPGNAIKFTIYRERPGGSPGDADIFGAQQYAPPLDREVGNR